MFGFKRIRYGLILVIALLLVGCQNEKTVESFNTSIGPEEGPTRYSATGVHDPSVIKGDDKIFIIGSHLDSAITEDYINWERYGSGVKNGNPVIPNVQEDMKEALKWAKTTTFWAGDIVRMKDGKYYYYYSVCEGTSPLAAIGYAVSDTVEGPYENKGIIMKSGRAGKLLTYEPDRHIQYDPNIHPNAIDPTVFYDKEDQLWMVYGSYSGGIYVLEMDEATKMPVPGQGYGIRLTGGKHTRIENPYIIYNEETDYYYLYMSFGGLGSGHGYQTRVARSKAVDGPYLDIKGQDINDISNHVDGFFDDDAINPYGNKLIGDFEFYNSDNVKMNHGYISPGGASVIYDESLDTTLMVMHTRFPGRGEGHEVRTHEVYMNESGWPVLAPIRYSGVNMVETNTDLNGDYQFIINDLVIIGPKANSQAMIVENNTLKIGDQTIEIDQNESHVSFNLDGVVYEGVSLKQWDVRQRKMVKVMTLQGDDNTTLWAIEE